MNTKNTKASNPNQVVFDEFSLLLSSNRGIFWQFAIILVLLFLVGPWVVFILTGLMVAFLLLARAFGPFYRLLRRLIRSKDSPAYLVEISFWQKGFTFISLIIPVWMIYSGIKGLLYFEFCLSLICTLSRPFLTTP